MPYKRGRLRLMYRGMHYCSSCAGLKSVMKERKKAVKIARTQLAGKNATLKNANESGSPSCAPESPPTPHDVPSQTTKPETPAAAAPPSIADPVSPTVSAASPTPHTQPPSTLENVPNVHLVASPDRDAAISPSEVIDNEFVLPDRTSAIEAPLGFELVEHSEVAEIGWKKTKSHAKWYSILWKH
jgi:hypothetical protein